MFGVFTYIGFHFMLSMGKSTSPMDPKGSAISLRDMPWHDLWNVPNVQLKVHTPRQCNSIPDTVTKIHRLPKQKK